MKRWKLWTAVTSGMLSLGGGSTYYFWPRTAAEVVENVKDAAPTSPHAVPPQPIPVRGPDFSATLPQFATPASFDAPAGEQGDAPSERSQDPNAPYAAVPPENTFAAPTSRFDLPAPAAGDASGYRASLTDTDSPPSEISAELAAPVEESVESGPTAAPPFPLMPGGINDIQAPPVGPDESSGEPQATEAATPDVPATLAPPKPLSGTLPEQPSVEVEPSELRTPPVEEPAASPANRFSNPGIPTAPSLRSDFSRGDGYRTSEPPAMLPENDSSAPARLVPQRTNDTRSPIAVPRASRLLSNAPGERKLEGLQTPSLTVERSAVEESQVGKPTKFVIRVRNVGQVPAQDVVVSDLVPLGTRFLSASPETEPSADGVVAWRLDTLAPGEERTLSMELLPESEGEIGSVATVTFQIQAAVRTIATKPLLKVEHTGPAKVLIGEEVPFQITVSNPGSGIATGVVVEVDVPEGLAHDGGREIMSDRFDLRPNESRKIDLLLKAVQAGSVESVVRAVGNTNLVAEHRTPVEVIAPKLRIGVLGPTRRFLDRPVKYQIGLSNPGTAPAQEVELVARLPRGLKYVSADHKGEYDPRLHAVLWSLEELPPNEQGVVELTAIPTDTGDQKLHIEARADLAVEERYDHTTVVEDIIDLVFTVTDENVPIEVGSDTTYQINIANNGTKVARNIQLAVLVPDGLQVIDSNGPTQVQQQGNQLIMQPIAELAQREQAVYRIAVKGTKPGDHVLRVQMLSDEFSAPVSKEEITKVYSDK